MAVSHGTASADAVKEGMEKELAISCRGLVHRYPGPGGGTLAVDGLDLEVPRGECFGLLGPNGAGKTTTIEVLEGLLTPTAGEVRVLGASWSSDAVALREKLGVTLQQTHLPDKLTVREVLALFRSFYKSGRAVDEVLKLVSLEEKAGAWTSRLSGGQKQRLAVACALVGDPELLFLDEPTTGLDPQSRRQLWDLVSDLRARGKTILLTTHYMDEAERLCDRVAVVDRGKVIAIGTPRELIASLGGAEVVELAFDKEADEAMLSALPSVQHVRKAADQWSLTVKEVHIVLPALLEQSLAAGLKLSRLSTHHATLEDVFVTLTGHQLRD